MSNRRAVPVEFRASGLSDAFSVGDSFPGAMALLQNLVPNPKAQGQWVPRPGAQPLITPGGTLWAGFNWGQANWNSGWGGITGAGTITGIIAVGHLIFGMVGSTSGATNGKDVPFVYNVNTGGIIDVTLTGSPGSLPASQPLVGDWIPPRFGSFPGRVVVTHPGFGGANKVGWIDYSGFSETGVRTGNTHSSIAIDGITPAANLAGWEVGDIISGPGIPANTTIVSIAADGLSLVMSQSATATASGIALTVTGGTPSNPIWGAGDTTPFNLTAVPTDVFNFNGRAYYAVPSSTQSPGGTQFSDVGFPLQIGMAGSGASQALRPLNGLDITCFGGLPINQTQTGPISSLFAFQGDSAILKITGDAALSNLSIQTVPNGLGTLAPNSLAPTPLGLMFVAPDGIRYVDFDGNAQPILGANGEGVNSPLINAQYSSRINAAYNEDVYRFSVQNGAKDGQPWEDYWLHVTHKMFSGPHTDPSGVVAPLQQSAGAITGHGFIFSLQGQIANLFSGSVIPNAQANYQENGAVLNCVWRTCYTADNQMLTENAIVESTLTLGLYALASLGVLLINEKGGIFDQLTLIGPTASPYWFQFNWGAANWGAPPTQIYQRDLPWVRPAVFKQIAMQVSVQAGTGLVIGPWRYNNIVLGYRLETFGGFV